MTTRPTVPVDVSEAKALHHQVGGHATGKSCLQACNGYVLKPFQDKDRGAREYAFYELVFGHTSAASPFETDGVDQEELTAALTSLRSFLPDYFGCIDSAKTDGQATQCFEKFLLLEDLTAKFRHPCIMDVKIGTKTYEDTASKDKIAYEMSKFPIQPEVGFRIQGLRVYNSMQETFVTYDKHFCREPTNLSEIIKVFAVYFSNQPDIRRQHLINKYMCRLNKFKAWFESQNHINFTASSLLFVYEGDATNVEEIEVDVRLIDFAHVQIAQTKHLKNDDGAILGIRTIIDCFKCLLQN